MDGNVAAPTTTPMSTGQLIGNYIKLRDKIDELKKAQAKQLEPLRLMMEQIEGMLLSTLDQAGADNLSTDEGTAFKSIATSVTVKHWSETLKYIQETENWELLEARVSKTAVKTIMEETGEIVPGVNVNQAVVLRVRRS